MSDLLNHDEKSIYVQYKSIFNQDAPSFIVSNHRLANLMMDYGIMHEEYCQPARAMFLALNHLKMQRNNPLLTDEIIFSMHKLP